MRFALVPVLLLMLGTTPAFARTWWSRACGRLLREKPTVAPLELRLAYERLEDEISRINRFSNRHLTAGLERLEHGPWALVVRPRTESGPWAFAETPGEWRAVVLEGDVAAFRAEASEVMRRNPGLSFELKSGGQQVWIEGELLELQRTRTMLVMLQYALETASGTKRPTH